MYRTLLSVAALLTCVASPAPVAGQTLSARPVLFADPVPGADPARGDVVLGRTTLKSALRIFAVELEEDSIRVPLGHGGNPAVLPGTELLVGGLRIRPHHRLDLGPDRYTLYFDENERLVAAIGGLRRIRRQELAAHYPNLRVEHRGSAYEGLTASIDPCVSLTATVWLNRGDVVEGLGYVYTCSTKVEKPRTRK